MHQPRSSNALTKAQLSELRERLIEARSDLLRNTPAESKLAAEGGQSGDPSDEAEENLQQHEALSMGARSRSRLAEIEQALVRVDGGTYGVSELSGEPIGYERLAAVPWARLTAAEQEREDRSVRP